MGPTGLYVHVPFCVRKCAYCDFYSVADPSLIDAYVAETARRLRTLSLTADTLYFGGGTPSLLGEERLRALLDAARPLLTPDAEITVEVNPGDDTARLIPALADAGVTRLSLGMQSHSDGELTLLTRRHTAADVDRAVGEAVRSGIPHLSLDVMLAIPGQTPASLRDTLAFAAQSGADHVSAYLLKIEPGTPFARDEAALSLPDEGETADRYLAAVGQLEAAGFAQYEISNFARPGGESRHNLKYWRDEEYLGLGPAAHSYYKGLRFFYPRDLAAYLNGCEPTPDGAGGSFEEFVMLRLRLREGLDFAKASARFPDREEDLARLRRRAADYEPAGLLTLTDGRVALTPRGFLVSNALIGALLLS